MSVRDAVRLADQATFGVTEAMLAQMRTQSPATWVAGQIALPMTARYRSGGTSSIHTNVSGTGFCDRPENKSDQCWQLNYSSHPLLWDFYRNATSEPDQLRQRVAFALKQIVVVSGVEVEGTYGLRNYQNMLLQNAFGNYREVLRKVALSPVMGDYLNNANNDKQAPNENFARELLQLFALGTCDLAMDGSLQGGACKATFNTAMVRSYAYAMTGWTYPAGGRASWGCGPKGFNCQFYDGDMVPAAGFHDANERTLFSGKVKAANSTPQQAMDAVLDSLMAHPNMAPFIGKQLIQALTTSNPSTAYVNRVANAFNSGRFVSEGKTFGTGTKGDLAATVAAVLLDTEARGDRVASTRAGKLREPVLMMTGILRALNGRTDGDPFGYWFGESLRQHAFRAPSVFNYYPPDYPVAGTAKLIGPAFGIHNANSALERFNYLTYLLDWDGSKPEADVPNAIGTKVNLDAFLTDSPDAAKLVDRLSLLAYGEKLPDAARTSVLNAVSFWTDKTDKDNWQRQRVKTAAYLVFGAPQFQMVR